MPIEIIDYNDTAVEVRLLCDNCSKYIGNRIMPIKEAHALKGKILCVQCKKNTHKPKNNSNR